VTRHSDHHHTCGPTGRIHRTTHRDCAGYRRSGRRKTQWWVRVGPGSACSRGARARGPVQRRSLACRAQGLAWPRGLRACPPLRAQLAWSGLGAHGPRTVAATALTRGEVRANTPSQLTAGSLSLICSPRLVPVHCGPARSPAPPLDGAVGEGSERVPLAAAAHPVPGVDPRGGCSARGDRPGADGGSDWLAWESERW